MTTNDIKLRFIEMRANNMSLASIANELHISKGTCSKWVKELESDIAVKQTERKAEIIDLYAMNRQHRINRLQAVLERLDKAISNADFSQMSPESLLKMKLRYESELSREYPISDSNGLLEYSYKAIVDKINNLQSKYESGEISTEQLKFSLSALDMMFKGISKESATWKPIVTIRRE